MKSRAAPALKKLEDFLTVTVNPAITAAAELAGLTVDGISGVTVGYTDPFSLVSEGFNRLMLVPDDRLRRDAARQVIVLPITIIAAIKTTTERQAADTQVVYNDALINVFEDDPTAGGAAFASRVESVEFYAPAPGGALIGLVVASATLDIDMLMEDDE